MVELDISKIREGEEVSLEEEGVETTHNEEAIIKEDSSKTKTTPKITMQEVQPITDQVETAEDTENGFPRIQKICLDNQPKKMPKKMEIEYVSTAIGQDLEQEIVEEDLATEMSTWLKNPTMTTKNK
eukprot:TRINITY_DN35327_c0_g1_i1.p1 TRINITY_DN35327_c0_g1~~TRINITY_DN35327_c0_g1_i1.p1  ORF type:complete len:127 (-),score=32.90 TRINITY_DN35327_c0_g1_i1:402-782(-)